MNRIEEQNNRIEEIQKYLELELIYLTESLKLIASSQNFEEAFKFRTIFKQIENSIAELDGNTKLSSKRKREQKINQIFNL